MFVVGLCGGIGAGKSTVAGRLGSLGAIVIDVDQIGRDVLAPDGDAERAVIEQFGTTIVDGSGHVDRAALAAIVFTDQTELARLESISHPAINAVLDRTLAGLEDEHPDDAVVVLDMAILAESDLGKLDSGRGYTAVVVVECDRDVRLTRLEGRGMSRADAIARMDSQASDADRRAIADYLIDNSGDEASLATAVDDLWTDLSRRARASGS